MLWKIRFREAILVSFVMFCFILVLSHYEETEVFYNVSRNTAKDNKYDDIEDAEASSNSWISHLCPLYKETPPGESLFQEEFLKLRWERPAEDTLYFTQTSCKKVLSSREACAIESASKHHPHRSVKMYMTAPSVDKKHPLMKVLMGLPNVEFFWLDLDIVFNNEALALWHHQRLWMYNLGKSFAFIRDAAKIVLLRHFGGTYIDLDAITLRPLPNVTNWLARIDDNHVSMAVASFNAEHRVLTMIEYGIPQVFDPLEPDAIGSILVTETLHEFCPYDITIPEDFTDLDTTEYCIDMTVFPINAFYPMSYKREGIMDIFTVRKGLGHKFFREHGDAYSLHLFSSLTNSATVEIGLDSILEEVARRNCPLIYDAIKKNDLIL